MLKVIAMQWDLESSVREIQDSNDELNTESCQATSVMLIEQTCGNGSSVPQKVAAKLCFTQSKIKDMWETYCTKTPLQWLWKVLRNCSHEDTADSSEVQSSWEFGTCVTCNHWPVQWR